MTEFPNLSGGGGEGMVPHEQLASMCMLAHHSMAVLQTPHDPLVGCSPEIGDPCFITLIIAASFFAINCYRD